MLKSFFELESDNDGKILPITSTDSYRLFVKAEYIDSGRIKKLQYPFLIANHKHIVDKHLGRYPVIYFTLKGCDGRFGDTINCVRSDVKQAFEKNKYLRHFLQATADDEHNDNHTREDARQRYEKFRKFLQHDVEIKADEVMTSLSFLSETLYKFHHKKVIILMDDYMQLAIDILRGRSYSDTDKKMSLDYYQNFMTKTFQHNPYLEKAVVTGTHPLTAELRQHAFANATECNLLSGKFMQYYGFNHREMENLLDFLNASTTTRQEIDHRFKGYNVNNRNLLIYKPASIARYIGKRIYHKYSIHSILVRYFIDNFYEVATFRTKILPLMAVGATVTVKLESQYFTWVDYEHLIRAMSRVDNVHKELCEKAFMLLFASGHLTLAKNTSDTGCGYVYEMKCPNMEVLTELSTKIR